MGLLHGALGNTVWEAVHALSFFAVASGWISVLVGLLHVAGRERHTSAGVS